MNNLVLIRCALDAFVLEVLVAGHLMDVGHLFLFQRQNLQSTQFANHRSDCALALPEHATKSG